ncbi:hypothetical protein TcYC6_0010750 [Trypanosoma cruzi]|nr:hypothetical protein TcYC6_0010750 [Trypanosoma cruzi]
MPVVCRAMPAHSVTAAGLKAACWTANLTGGDPIGVPSPGNVRLLGSMTPLLPFNRRQWDVDEWKCACYLGHTVRCSSPAFSCAAEGVACGGKVAVRSWRSSCCVSSFAACVHCGIIFGVVTFSPSGCLAGCGWPTPGNARLCHVKALKECRGLFCRLQLCFGAFVCAHVRYWTRSFRT